MGTARSSSHATVGSRARSPGSVRRSALAGGLAIGLILLATSPGGAEPHGGTEQDTTVALSEQIIRASAQAWPGSGHESEAKSTPGAADLGADLDVARQEESAARATLADAGTALDQASGARARARDRAGAAQDEMMRARLRLGDLIGAETAAAAELDRAVAHVERTRAGSKTRRSAFTRWQMAAVAERAAHARRAVGEDVGARLFAKLGAAEAALADAELALGEARSAHLKAVGAQETAFARVMDLEAIALAGGTSPVGRASSGDGPSPVGGQSPPSQLSESPRAVERAQP